LHNKMEKNASQAVFLPHIKNSYGNFGNKKSFHSFGADL